MNCHYCTLPTTDGDQFHEICAYEVGPLHSCPDCNDTPCTACDPNGDQS